MHLRSDRVALLFLALCAFVPSSSASAPNDNGFSPRPDELQAILDLSLLETALHVHQAYIGPIHTDEHWIAATELARYLPGWFFAAIPTQDPWGVPYSVRTADSDVILIMSAGRNRIFDSREAVDGMLTEGRLSQPSLNALLDDDMLFVGHQLIKGPRSDADRHKINMADLRTIGVAMEAYKLDHGDYPRLPPGLSDATVLSDALVPTYLRQVPELDAWGGPFEVRIEQGRLFLFCFGADGMPAEDYSTVPLDSLARQRVPFAEPEGDIVFSDDFLSYPAGMLDY